MRQTIPFLITSLALMILFQAYEPVESLASKIELFGKNLALNTQWQREFELFIILHTCFANKASLNFSISLNPMPPNSLALQSFFQLTQ